MKSTFPKNIKLEVAEKNIQSVVLQIAKSSLLVQNYSYIYYSSDLLVGSSSLGYGPLDLEFEVVIFCSGLSFTCREKV